MVETTIAEVRHLFEEFHGYGSVGATQVYCFAVVEGCAPVAAYVWQPPPPGCSRSVLPAAPAGVLSLSRMVALPRERRRLNHVSKPLRRQMRTLVDRERWPALVTFSDEGQGHTGHVYKCSGWEKTTRRRVPVWETPGGRRQSTYWGGRHRPRDLVRAGYAWIQRWEHHVPGGAEAFHAAYRQEPTGKTWRSGAPAMRWVQRHGQQPSLFGHER